jgi:broad specificity phosphatase PhoE
MTSLIRTIRSLLVGSVLTIGAAGAALAQHAAPTTVLLVRHAEKAAEPANDPPLTAAGEARARSLLDALRDANVSVVITTQFTRTKATAQPTASAFGLTPQVIDAQATPAQVARAVRGHAGHTVLVVGHSNTLPAIIEALGAKRPPPICDAVYDNLFVVTIDANGKAGVVRAKYGARSPEDASCAAMK